MPVLESHNTIFIHIPKTGGTTVLRMLGLNQGANEHIFYYTDNTYEYYHASARMLKSKIPQRYNECYKFTIVRNPYDRLLSEFAWKKQDARAFNVKNMDFAEFVTQLYDQFDQIQSRTHKEKSHFIPQSQFVLDDVEIFKFEQFDECLGSISKKLGVPVGVKYNGTIHEPYESYYDARLSGMVYDMYYADFKLFGYEKMECHASS